MFTLIYIAIAALVFAIALCIVWGRYASGRESAGRSVLAHLLRVVPLGCALGAFLAATFFAHVVFDLLFPHFGTNPARVPIFLGFLWQTPLSFRVGLIASVLYSWIIAQVLGGLYNAAVSRRVAA